MNASYDEKFWNDENAKKEYREIQKWAIENTKTDLSIVDTKEWREKTKRARMLRECHYDVNCSDYYSF